MLTLVPTPIGNLEDITLRAIRMLKEADSILAEDTRVTGRLLQHLGISRPMQSFHAANEHKVLERIVDQLKAGSTMSLVTDAGTPGISDPGFLLVRACIREGIAVECLPGPTAFVPALVLSGLPCERFCFEGFLPHKKGRQSRLKALATEDRTCIFYESTHRLLKTLEQMMEYFGIDRQASVCRELTKMFEETQRGSLGELHEHFSHSVTKGEFVIVVAGKPD